MMKAVNIHKVYYVDNEKNLVCENVRDMISIHASSVARFIYSVKTGSEYTATQVPYFEGLLKMMFPKEIKRSNFESFVKHDLSNVLPDHTYVIKSADGINIISILNSEKKEIVTGKLLD